SPRLSAVVKLGPTQRLRFLWTRSVRAPSHLYNYAKLTIPNSAPTALAPGVPFIPPFRFQGDQDLDSVTMDSWEVGYRASYRELLRFNATVYLNALRDFHALTRPNPADPFLFGVENTAHTRAWGTELSAEFRYNDYLHGFASYHFETARGDLQRTTPTNKVILGLRGRLLPWLRYSVTSKYVAHTRYDTDEVDASFIGDTAIPSRFNVDGFIGIQVRPGVELGVKARNIFHQVRRQFPLGDEIGSEVVATVRVEY
ncbi:MAG: TonB-dependent receptor domain-containing protein, partial [Myxococcota bacterium]